MILLIDEIDKADLEFPNDLLWELDQMKFYIHETKRTVKAKHRPIVIITSNAEKELPDAFLRRCNFHNIQNPDQTHKKQNVKTHYPNKKQNKLKKQTKKNYNASFEVDTADPLLSFCCLFECFVRSSAGNDGITYNTDSQRI